MSYDPGNTQSTQRLDAIALTLRGLPVGGRGAKHAKTAFPASRNTKYSLASTVQPADLYHINIVVWPEVHRGHVRPRYPRQRNKDEILINISDVRSEIAHTW